MLGPIEKNIMHTFKDLYPLDIVQEMDRREVYADITILVAGAAGFLPSALCEYYLLLGANVIGIDNFVTGSRSNIEWLSKHPKFRFFQQNVCEKLPDFSKHKIDYIYNMASPASPIDFDRIPLEILQVNSQGTWNLLELAKIKKARFLEASTSEVYGDPLVHPQSEEYLGNVNPIGPRSCYDESKRFSEALTMSYHRQFGVDTRIVRIFNTYGPRMRPNDGRVIPNFIRQALNNEPITVYGDGSQTRSFCFLTDLIYGIHLVMTSQVTTPVNVGNPDELSVINAAKLVVQALESKSEIQVTHKLPQDDPKQRRPDITKLKSLGPFNPQISFEQGIRLTALYFREQLSKGL